MTARLRLALFTHDAYGMGHVRRSIRIVGAIADLDPDAAILLMSGSPSGAIAGSLPENADFVKIPTIVTSGDRAARPPTLPIGLAGLARLRARIVRTALQAFDPDVVLVDNFPLGTRLELLPALEALRSMRTSVVLGLRDVVDPPEKVRADWGRDGLYDVLDRYYDRIIVYGVREVLDVATAYALPGRVASKVTYAGYVTENRARALDPGPPETGRPVRLLATVGGGGDGLPLLEAFVGSLNDLPAHEATVVAGEFMGPQDRAVLRRLCGSRPHLSLFDHVDDLPARLAASDLVVAMGGYNTCAEIIGAGVRAIIVPRTWQSGEHASRSTAKPDGEQLERALALHRLGLVGVLHPRELSAARLAEAMRTSLKDPRPSSNDAVLLDGAGRVARLLLDLAAGGAPERD